MVGIGFTGYRHVLVWKNHRMFPWAIKLLQQLKLSKPSNPMHYTCRFHHQECLVRILLGSIAFPSLIFSLVLPSRKYEIAKHKQLKYVKFVDSLSFCTWFASHSMSRLNILNYFLMLHFLSGSWISVLSVLVKGAQFNLVTPQHISSYSITE